MRGNFGTVRMSCVSPGGKRRKAFTLIEMILVVAVIGIMTSLVIAAITNSTADARRVIARQQQATVQEALNAWIASKSIAAAQSDYAGKTVAERLTLIQDYLDTNARWFSEKTFNGSGNMQTPNMQSIGASLSFGDWSSTSYPVVTLQE